MSPVIHTYPGLAQSRFPIEALVNFYSASPAPYQVAFLKGAYTFNPADGHATIMAQQNTALAGYAVSFTTGDPASYPDVTSMIADVGTITDTVTDVRYAYFYDNKLTVKVPLMLWDFGASHNFTYGSAGFSLDTPLITYGADLMADTPLLYEAGFVNGGMFGDDYLYMGVALLKNTYTFAANHSHATIMASHASGVLGPIGLTSGPSAMYYNTSTLAFYGTWFPGDPVGYNNLGTSNLKSGVYTDTVRYAYLYRVDPGGVLTPVACNNLNADTVLNGAFLLYAKTRYDTAAP